jgi:hypothetical protein
MTPFGLLHFFIYDSTSRHYNLWLQCVIALWCRVSERSWFLFGSAAWIFLDLRLSSVFCFSWVSLFYLCLSRCLFYLSLLSVCLLFSVCLFESESYVTTDGQSASLSWYKAPIWGLQPDFYCHMEYVGQLRVCWYGALSLTRGQVCRLQLLLALASAVILGSESPWDSRPYFTVSDLRLLLSCLSVCFLSVAP